jgi:adenylosuccinate synthase
MVRRREEDDMSVGTTMRWMGRSARNRAEVVGHQMKDRALEKRLERASDETDRLRFENELLRDEVSENRTEHSRILDLLEKRLSEPSEIEVEVEKKSHKGRWLLFLMALGGGAYAWMRNRANGSSSTDEWAGHLNEPPTTTQSGTSTL